jgi:DNA replication and repair protein RecF
VHVTWLALTDFRSYVSAELALEDGVSTLLGANGQGKTNLVEAVSYLATLGSHRVASDAPLVRHGAQCAIVRAQIAAPGRATLLELEINPGRPNRVQLNHSPVPRPREVLGVLRTVLFAPEDLALVKGEPDQRRRFLDDLLVATAPRYAGVRADYERVVRQRTALLKSLRGHPPARVPSRSGGPRADGRPDGATAGGAAAGAAADDPPASRAARTLEVWDEHLVRTGVELVAARLKLTAALRPLVGRCYAAVAGAETAITVGYRQSAGAAGRAGSVAGAGPLPGQVPGEPSPDPAGLAEGMREALARSRAEELDRGVCLVGPHRDDVDLRIGELPARGYASHGESWSMALALRLASYELLRSLGGDPVLLLDDVFAELDTGRRARLAALVAGAEQVLVTAAVSADVPPQLDGARFEVAGGRVTRAG